MVGFVNFCGPKYRIFLGTCRQRTILIEGSSGKLFLQLKTLIGIIKILSVTLPTPTGKAAEQIFDGFTTVIDYLAQ